MENFTENDPLEYTVEIQNIHCTLPVAAEYKAMA
jgi:hypothetical protein